MARRNHQYLDISPELTLMRETQGIADALHIMNGIYSQETTVMKDLHKYFQHQKGPPRCWDQSGSPTTGYEPSSSHKSSSGYATQPIGDSIEQIENRLIEIKEMEKVANRTIQRVRPLSVEMASEPTRTARRNWHDTDPTSSYKSSCLSNST